MRLLQHRQSVRDVQLIATGAERKLLQLNKLCAGIQCLEGAITAKLGGTAAIADGARGSLDTL